MFAVDFSRRLGSGHGSFARVGWNVVATITPSLVLKAETMRYLMIRSQVIWMPGIRTYLKAWPNRCGSDEE